MPDEETTAPEEETSLPEEETPVEEVPEAEPEAEEVPEGFFTDRGGNLQPLEEPEESTEEEDAEVAAEEEVSDTPPLSRQQVEQGKMVEGSEAFAVRQARQVSGPHTG